MRTLNSDQQTSYGNTASSICRLVDITLANGHVFHYTDLDEDVFVGLTQYRADVGVDVSSVKIELGTSPAAISITLGLTAGSINKRQIESGLLNNAQVSVSTFDYRAPLVAPLLYYTGLVANVSFKDNYYALLDVEPILSFDYTVAADKFQLTCRVDYGSPQCGKDITATQTNFTVTDVLSPQVFVTDLTQADAFWNYGEAVFSSGANNGVAVEVGSSLADGTITLRLVVPFALVIGDTGTIYEGCDKILSGGCTLHDNVINFRGEPFVVAAGTASATASATTTTTTEPADPNAIVETVYGAWIPEGHNDYINVPDSIFSEPLFVVYWVSGITQVVSPNHPGITLGTQTAIQEFKDWADTQGISYSSDTHIYTAGITYIHADGSFSYPTALAVQTV